MHVRLSRDIAAPPEQVFALITDFSRAAETISGIKKLEVLTDEPTGVGTRFRETREMMGREATEEMEIVEFVPGSHYVVQANSCGCLIRSTIRCAPTPAGTEFSMSMDAKPVTFFAKVMSPLGKLMAGSMKKCIEQDLDDVEQAIEGRTAAPATV